MKQKKNIDKNELRTRIGYEVEFAVLLGASIIVLAQIGRSLL